MFKKKIKKDLKNEDYTQSKAEDFHFDLISDYHNKKQNKGFVLTNRTCNDIDFDEFFMFADHTTSIPGQQYLYNHLRKIPESFEHFEEQETTINYYDNNPDKQLKTVKLLNRISSFDAYYINSLFQDEHIKEPKWYFAIPILAITNLLLLIIIPFYLKAILPFIGITTINLIIHYWNKHNLYQYINALPQLSKLNYSAKEILKMEAPHKNTTRVKAATKILDTVRSRMLLFKLENKVDTDFGAIFWSLLEFVKIIFLLEPLLLFSLLKIIDKKREEIHIVFSFIGNIDMDISILNLRKALPYYCLPEILKPDKTINANELYHPLIPDCVSNSISLKGKSALLTGSNMSGKTTFIRTVGLNALAAYTINTCFAKSFSLPKMNILSAIRISDDLMNDKSYYLEEVLIVKELLKEGAVSPCLFLLDELYKGTNTIERIAAGKAVLSTLNSSSNSIVFATTHDTELTDLLIKEYDIYNFCESISNSTIDFDYLLKKGKLQQTNAIKILKINGYPTELIKEATEIAQQLKTK